VYGVRLVDIDRKEESELFSETRKNNKNNNHNKNNNSNKKTKKMTLSWVGDVYVGAETGLVKSVQLHNQNWINLGENPAKPERRTRFSGCAGPTTRSRKF